MVYQYTQKEKIIMGLINSISNISFAPTVFLIKYYEKVLPYYIGYFSMMVSILYHIGESLDIKIFLEQLKWHELDNIGAIYAFTQMSIPLTRFRHDKNYILKKNYLSFFMVLLFQQRGPWELINTFMPLIIDFSIAIFQVIKYGMPEYNKKTLIKACIFISISLIFFFKGLDDLNDYLRIWHCLWHLSVGLSSLYLIQIQEKRFISYKEIIYIHFGLMKIEKEEYTVVDLTVTN